MLEDQAGAAAVKTALVVLRNFYDSQSFVQQVPEMAAYGGMQAGKSGVVGMLEVIVSDFVRLEAETKSAEAMGAAEYDNFMKDAEADEVADNHLKHAHNATLSGLHAAVSCHLRNLLDE